MNDAQPMAIDYAPPVSGRRVVSWTFLLAGMALWGYALLLAYVAGRFEQIFMDFNTALPVMTRLVLGTARWLRDPLGGMVTMGLVIGGMAFLIPLVFAWRRQDPAERKVVRLGVVVALFVVGWIVITVVAAASLLLPMISLMGSVTGA